MRASTKRIEISDYMTLGKATVEKLEAIEYNEKRVEAVGKLTKPRMADMLMMYGNNFRVKISKGILRLDCIIALNYSGYSITVRWYNDEEHLRVKVRRR